jgi:ferredoxin
MRLRVDTTRCSGIGLCEMTAPAVYEVGDDGLSHLLQPEPGPGDISAAKEAISNCPTGALSLDSDIRDEGAPTDQREAVGRTDGQWSTSPRWRQ